MNTKQKIMAVAYSVGGILLLGGNAWSKAPNKSPKSHANLLPATVETTVEEQRSANLLNPLVDAFKTCADNLHKDFSKPLDLNRCTVRINARDKDLVLTAQSEVNQLIASGLGQKSFANLTRPFFFILTTKEDVPAVFEDKENRSFTIHTSFQQNDYLIYLISSSTPGALDSLLASYKVSIYWWPVSLFPTLIANGNKDASIQANIDGAYSILFFNERKDYQRSEVSERCLPANENLFYQAVGRDFPDQFNSQATPKCSDTFSVTPTKGISNKPTQDELRTINNLDDFFFSATLPNFQNAAGELSPPLELRAPYGFFSRKHLW